MLYFSLVHSHLSYANIVWASTHKTKLKKLQSLQNHACKTINYLNKLDSATHVMKKMKVLDIVKLNSFQILIFMHKYKNNLLPNVFSDIFSLKFSQKYNLRSNTSRDYYSSLKNSKKSNFSIMTQGPLLWNQMKNIGIKDLNSMSLFKRQIKLHFLNI